MRMSKWLMAAAIVAATASCRSETQEKAVAKNQTKPVCVDCAQPSEPKTSLTEADFKKKLTADQYRVLRQGGTESPGSSPLNGEWREGVYSCAACGHELFNSKTKYESHCGWPSYWDQIPGHVKFNEETLEATCASCDSHLGHVFADGPKPTGKRY